MNYFSSDITVIGLGAMGAVLATTLLSKGRKVTVWNRTRSRGDEAVKLGAVFPDTAAEAIAASPITIFCMLDYQGERDLLFTPAGTEAARGRTIVSIGTGSPAEAEEMAAWAAGNGVSYLEGGILCYPRDIGGKQTTIVYSGDEKVFRTHEAILADLAGGQKLVGNNPRAANIVYFALWNFYFSALGGFLESAPLAEKEGVDVAAFHRIIEDWMLTPLRGGLADAADRITRRDFSGDQATVDVHSVGLDTEAETLNAAGLPSRMIEAFNSYLKDASAQGLGGKDISSTYMSIVGRA